jgi:hypothetical protein
VARYRVRDERLRPEHLGCERGETPAPDFLCAGPAACSFTLHGQAFDLLDKCVVDANGRLAEYWQYLGEGAAIYTAAQLQQDSLYAQERGLPHFRIMLAPEGKGIVDGQDTLRVAQHFPAERLLLVQQKAPVLDGQRLLYQYE